MKSNYENLVENLFENTSRETFERLKNKIWKKEKIKMTIYGDKAEIKTRRTNKMPRVRNIGGGEYVVLSSGEIKKYKKNKNRGDNEFNLRKTNERIKQVAMTNTKSLNKILFMTPSYNGDYNDRKNDISRLKQDGKYLIKKLRERYKDEFGQLEYMAVTEPYENGGYHQHYILFFNESPTKVFIDWKEVEELWGYGNVAMGQPINKEQVYRYLAPYDAKGGDSDQEKMGKKYGRQMAMPSGTRIVDMSRGLEKPREVILTYWEAEQELQKEKFDIASPEQSQWVNKIKDNNGDPVMSFMTIKNEYEKIIRRQFN